MYNISVFDSRVLWGGGGGLDKTGNDTLLSGARPTAGKKRSVFVSAGETAENAAVEFERYSISFFPSPRRRWPRV